MVLSKRPLAPGMIRLIPGEVKARGAGLTFGI